MQPLTLLEAAELLKAGTIDLPADLGDTTAIVVGLDLRVDPSLIAKIGDGREVRIPIGGAS